MKIRIISFLIACFMVLGLSACSENADSSSKKDSNSTSTNLPANSGNSEGEMELEYSTTEYSGVIVFNDGQFYFQNTDENIYAAIKEKTDITYLFTNEKASISDLENGLQAFADIVIEVNPTFIGDYSLGDVVALRINN